MKHADVVIRERNPTLEEYLALADAVGWSKYVTAETAETALAHTLFAVVAERGGVAVGMARIVGDGALFFYVQDVVVAPAVQGQGVGAALMTALMAWLDRSAPDRAFVGLFSASGKSRFYERFGFATASSDRPAMYQYLRMPDQGVPRGSAVLRGRHDRRRA